MAGSCGCRLWTPPDQRRVRGSVVGPGAEPWRSQLPLTDSTWRLVEDAFLEYAALVFPGQHLSDDAQVAFGRRFGEIEILRENKLGVQITNRKPDGSLFEPDDFRFKALRGNEGWHIDSTYMPLAAKAGLLTAIEVPPEGGDPVVPMEVYQDGLAVEIPRWQPWARHARQRLEELMGAA